jgi:hypothetical protein
MSRINTYTLPGVEGYQSGTYSSFLNGTGLRIKSFFIPAGTFVAGDVITIESIFTRSNNTDNIRCDIYWNETDDVTNTPVLMALASNAVGDGVCNLIRSFAIVSSTNTVSMSTSYNKGTDFSATDDGKLNLSLSVNTAINWDVDSYIIFTTPNGGTVRYFRVIK